MSVQKDKANDSFLEKWTQVTILTNLHRKPKKYAVSSIDNIVNFCLVLLHGQNNFCLRQNLNCPGQKCFVQDKIFCPWLKSPFLLLKSPWKWLLSSKMDFKDQRKIILSWQKDWSWLFYLGQKFLSWTKMILSRTNLLLS